MNPMPSPRFPMVARLLTAISLLLLLSACGGGGSSGSDTGPTDVQASLVFSASPDQVAFGGKSTLTWTSEGVSSCTASGDWSGPRDTSGSEEIAGLQENASFVLECSGEGGTVSKSVSVTVGNPDEPPVVTLMATPESVTSGETAELAWSATNADTCTASGAWSGPRATSGSETTDPLTADSTFTLTCSGTAGQVTDSVTVTVSGGSPAPTLTLTADPLSVTSGDSTTLSWSATNVDSCTASGGWSGSRATSGSEQSAALSADTTFTLTCSGTAGQVTDSVDVTVSPAGSLFTDLSVLDTANATDWSIQANIQAGDTMYGDRIYTLDTVPASVAGSDWIRSANDSKAFADTPLVSFTVTQDAWIVVAHDDRITTKPDWMSGWSDTGEDIVNSEPQTFSLYEKFFSAGSTVELGTNGSSSTSMYLVTVRHSASRPVVTLDATPAAVDYEGTTTLSWSATNADACTASGGWSGARQVSGSEVSAPLTADTVFTLTCTGPGGSGIASVTVSVGAPPPGVPVITFDANPTQVPAGDSSTLTWSATDAISCTASGGWSGARATSGSETTDPITADSTFTLTCDGTAGSASASVAVAVIDSQPVAVDDSATTTEDVATTIDVLANDQGLNDAPVTVSVTQPPANGIATVETDGTITYQPDTGFAGSDSFTYTVTDNDGDSATATVTVDVTCQTCVAGQLVIVSWPANPVGDQVIGYRVYLDSTPTGSGSVVANLTETTPGFDMNAPSVTFDGWVDLGLLPGEQACFRIGAYNLMGESAQSEATCITW